MKTEEQVYEAIDENQGWKGVLLTDLPRLCPHVEGTELTDALNKLASDERIYFECDCCVSNTEEVRVKTSDLVTSDEE